MRPLLVMLLVCWGGLVHAAPLPGFLDSSQIEAQLPTPNLPVDAYRPAAPVPAIARAACGAAASAVDEHAGAGAQGAFRRGHRLPLERLARALPAADRPQASLGELVELTDRLTQRYRQDGYLLSYAFLPPQDFSEGRVRVVLVEGYIGDYQVEGDIGPARGYLAQLLDKLMTERPLTRANLERYTGLIGRIPGVTARAQVLAPGTADGARGWWSGPCANRSPALPSSTTAAAMTCRHCWCQQQCPDPFRRTTERQRAAAAG
jgi:hypothetical protein